MIYSPAPPLSQSKTSRSDIYVLSALAFITVVSCTALFIHWIAFPPCEVCDSVGYGLDAASVQKDLLSAPLPSAGLRTYGYPAFLGIVYAFYDWDPAWGIFSPRVAIVQTTLYLAACFAVFFAIVPVNRKFAWCVAAGLMCNPFVLNYVPLRLTEGVTASLAIFMVACAVRLDRSIAKRQMMLILFAGSFLAGFAMMVRPASLTLFVAWAMFVLFMLWRHEGQRRIIIVTAGAGMLLPLLPQIAVNFFLYGKVGFMPTRGLGDSGSMSSFQTLYGLANLKYMTVVAPDRSAAGIFYPNHFFTSQDIKESGVWLYLQHPFRGAATALSHLFQSVNHDYFFTYVYDRDPSLGAPANFLGHATLFAGLVAAVAWTVASIRARQLSGVAVFIVFTIAGTVALNCIVVAETRFGMLIYLVAVPLAIWGISEAGANRRLALIGFSALYGLAATALSFQMIPSS